MTFTLKRIQYEADGIFGRLMDDAGNVVAVTLEHAFFQADGSVLPKLYNGTFTCVLGDHTLEHHPAPFKAYEIIGVVGHSKILIHFGNFNRDSDGCVLVGSAMIQGSAGQNMITNSQNTFAEFMKLTAGIESFALIVE